MPLCFLRYQKQALVLALIHTVPLLSKRQQLIYAIPIVSAGANKTNVADWV